MTDKRQTNRNNSAQNKVNTSGADANGTAKRWLFAGFQILFGLVVWETGKLVGMFAEELFLGEKLGDGSLHYGVQAVAAQLGALLFLLLFQFRWIRSKFQESRNLLKQTQSDRAVQALDLLALVLAALGLNFLLWGSGLAETSEGFAQTAAAQATVPVGIGLFLYVIAAPFAEELMFRGVMYGRLRWLANPLQAAIVSAVLFGLYHGNSIQAVYGICMALLLCFLYEKVGGLWASLLGHAAANLCVYLVIDLWAPIWLVNDMRITLIAGILLLAAAAGLLALGMRKAQKS